MCGHSNFWLGMIESNLFVFQKQGTIRICCCNSHENGYQMTVALVMGSSISSKQGVTTHVHKMGLRIWQAA